MLQLHVAHRRPAPSPRPLPAVLRNGLVGTPLGAAAGGGLGLAGVVGVLFKLGAGGGEHA